MNQQDLIFATNNQHKVDEIRAVLGELFLITTLKEAGIHIDIPEPHDTLAANASEKSWTIFKISGKNCFSGDTGLEVEALNGEPGVKSARYAGEGRNFQDNIDKLLLHLEGNSNRKARFKTVISLIVDQQEYLFEGICEGRIASSQHGLQGFGYDPVFIPEGATNSCAEMSREEKNSFSHRKKAVDRMIYFLSNYQHEQS